MLFFAYVFNSLTWLCLYPYQPTVSGEIQSPMGVASVEFVDPREPVAVRLFFYSPSGLLVSVYTSSLLLPPPPLKEENDCNTVLLLYFVGIC